MRFILLLSLFLVGSLLHAQVQNVTYGKNRERFHDDQDQWYYFESDHFFTYWYGKSRRVGQTTVKVAESEFQNVINAIEHRPRKKINLFVFSDLTDMNQSNIGLEDALESTQRDVKTVGNKVFVYFEEDYDKLRVQIREGMAQVIIADIYNPGLLESSLEANDDYEVPQWFHQGLAAYVGENWSPEVDADFKRFYKKHRKLKFKRMASRDPRLAGHSFWYLLEILYGRKFVANLVYLTKINSDINDAFFYLFGVRTKELIKQWENYYSELYKKEFDKIDQLEDSLQVFSSKKLITDLYTPEDNNLIVSENLRGRKKLLWYDVDRGKKSKILRKGYVNYIQKTDYNYPQTSIDRQRSICASIYERRDVIYLRLIDLNTGDYEEQILPERIERVSSFDFLGGDTLVMSVFHNGAYDIFTYKWGNRQSTQITEDVFVEKDLQTITIDGKRGVVFASDRNGTELKRDYALQRLKGINSFDVYFLELGGQPVIRRISNTPGYDEHQPYWTDGTLYYMSELNGIQSVFRQVYDIERGGDIYWLDGKNEIYQVHPDTIDNPLTLERIYKTQELSFVGSTPVIQITQTLYPVKDFVIDEGEGEVLFLTRDNKRSRIHKQLLTDLDLSVRSTFLEQKERKARIQNPKLIKNIMEAEGNFVSTRWGNMQSFEDLQDYLRNKEEELVEVYESKIPGQSPTDTFKNMEIMGSQIVPYRLQFTNFGFSTTLDNQPLFGGLDQYSVIGGEREFDPQPIGIMPRLTFKDLLEDHVVEIGFRLPTALDGTEVFVQYNDLRKKLDKHYAFYRRSQTRNEALTLTGLDNIKSRTVTLLGRYGVTYPLDVFNSIRARATLRSDRTEFLLGDQRTTDIEPTVNTRFSIGAEYVFDNSMVLSNNILRGSRMKAYVEGFQKVNLNLRDDIELGLGDDFMTIVGMDLRHYINVLEHSVLALRLAGETSFGTENVLYYLGGSDNWLNQSQDNTTPIPQDVNFGWATTAPSVRGFQINARNGSTYALFNSELRLPVFHYLGLKHSKAGIIRDFQLCGFFDMGTAWQGINPFDDDNPLNTQIIEDPGSPIRVIARYDRDPIIYGYGAGVRTTILGYFLRLDYGWGIESGIIQDPRLHLSLGLDF